MRYLPLLILLLLCTCVRAQIGLHPPAVDWQKIETTEGRVLFPKGYEARAKRVATLIELLNEKHTRSIGEQQFDVDIVLQTPNMTINGFVGLAPFRSGFFATPPQSFSLLSTADWMDLLTIHEFRHVQQNSNERRGLTKLVSYLQGQFGWAVLSGIAVPNWFAEGDATIYETAMSPGGRGRTPAFSGTLRSLLAEDIIYKYPVARNNSFRRIVPDHYRYGYGMLTYARERYGNDVWRKVLHQGAAQGGLLYSFSRALKKETGLSTPELYATTMADLKAAQDSLTAARAPFIEGQPIGATRKDIVNYRFPAMDGEGRLLALRSGFKVLPQLVEIDPAGGPDRVVTNLGIQREPYVDVHGKFAVWMERRQHPRYTNLQFSDITLYELGSGRKRQLTENGKYVSPSLSFDGRQIVSVYHDPLAGPPEIVILNTVSGEVESRFRRNATSVSFPRFSPDGKTVYFFDQQYSGIAIMALDLASGQTTTLKERSPEAIDLLRVAPGGTLVYASGRDGVDNIYQLEPASGDIVQLTNVAVGATMPLLTKDGYLIYSTPTPKGLRLQRLAFGGDKNLNGVYGGLYAGIPGGLLPAGPSYYERAAGFVEEAVDLSSTVEAKEYPVSDFSDNLGGIKLHSWSYNGSYVSPGAIIAATNALNTIAIDVDGQYNLNEKRSAASASVNYGGLFPVLRAAVELRDRNYSTFRAGVDTVFNRVNLNQLTVSGGLRVPLTWVSGNFQTNLTPAAEYTYYALSNNEGGELPDNFGGLGFQLTFSSFQRLAYQQVQSRLGASLFLRYDQGFGEEDLGDRFLLRSAINLPGLFATHGLKLDFDYQREPIRNAYQFPDAFRYARGYVAPAADRVYRLGVNYQLPILYPDFGIAGVTYFQRVRLNAFYDYHNYSLEGTSIQNISASSVGGQFLFDNVWLNAQDITVGFELAYRLDRDLFSGEANDLRFRFLVSGGF